MRPVLAFRGGIDVTATGRRALGAYTIGVVVYHHQLDEFDAVVSTPTTVRRHSLLGLDVVRDGTTLTATAAARQYLIPPNAYVA